MAHIWPLSELPVCIVVPRTLFDKLRLSPPLAAFLFTVTTFTLIPGAALAQEIIRCPDWRLLVSPAVLRTSTERTTGESFDAKLQMARPVRPRTTPASTTATGGAGGKRQAQVPAICTYKVQPGDTLGKISARHLGRSNRWPELARANPGVDPKQLRIGTVINLPCAATAGQGSAASGAGTPLAGTGFLATLFGQNTPAASEPGKKAEAGAGTGTGTGTGSAESLRPTPRPVPPLPTWSAKAGEDFATVLKRWGKAAKYQIVIRTTDAWTIGVPIRLQTDFENAVAELVKGLGSDGRSPPVRVYKNKVIQLGGL